MADEMINGVDREEGRETPNPNDENEVNELIHKLKSLELEKVNLIRENDESKERIEKYVSEIEGLRSENGVMKEKIERMEREIELAEDGKRAMESIMKRAMELETEVARLQHDLGNSMNESEEANKEVVEMKRVVEEKGLRVEGLEREVEDLKTGKSECEIRVRDLERKIGVLEVKELEGKSEKVRIEMELKEKIQEKEREVSGLLEKIGNFEAAVTKDALELEKCKKEKNGLEVALREAEEKMKGMEVKLVELQKDLDSAGSVIGGLKGKATEAANGDVIGSREFSVGVQDKGLKLDWPVVAVGSSGAIALAASMAYIYSRRH